MMLLLLLDRSLAICILEENNYIGSSPIVYAEISISFHENQNALSFSYYLSAKNRQKQQDFLGYRRNQAKNSKFEGMNA